MAKRPVRRTHLRTRRDQTLDQRLHGAVEAPPPDLQQQLAIAIGQRDTALAALNRRANYQKLLTEFDAALLHMEQGLGILTQLEGEIGDRCRRLTAALGREDNE